MGAFLSAKFDPVKDIPDLTGKVAIVTGGNRGTGFGTVKHLARRGAKVYMAARNETKATEAIARLKSEGLEPGNGEILWLKLNLSDPRDAKKAAEEFLAMEKRLDILVNNAAILLIPDEKTSDGVHEMMVVNHISPFVFTRELLPILKKTSEEPDADVRIVNLTSTGHRYLSSSYRFQNLEQLTVDLSSTRFPELRRFLLSKLTNILWTSELQRRLDAEGVPIIALSLNPGAVDTFAHRLPIYLYPFKIIMHLFFSTWERGAYTSVHAAASPTIREQAEKYKGAFIENEYGVVAEPSENARDPEIAAELWKTTEEFLGSVGLN